MSKMKELDSIAQGVADHLDEILVDTIDWAVDGTIVDELEGDEYKAACDYIMDLAVRKLFTNNLGEENV